MKDLACAYLLALLLAFPTAAFAHAHLKTSVPSADSVVSAPPHQISINFTEGVEPAFSSIEVQDASGNRVDNGSAHIAPGDNTELIVDLKALQPGKYNVTWHATAVDTHKTQGTYSFTVTQ